MFTSNRKLHFPSSRVLELDIEITPVVVMQNVFLNSERKLQNEMSYTNRCKKNSYSSRKQES